jgi:hypothetical protein
MLEIAFESKSRIRFSIGDTNYLLVEKKRKRITILCFFVEEKYRCQHLGTQLLLYSILILCDWYPTINEFHVDDMSDYSNSVHHNIYRRLGFRCLVKPKYCKINKTFILYGPEKKLVVTKYSLFWRYYLPKLIQTLERHQCLLF